MKRRSLRCAWCGRAGADFAVGADWLRLRMHRECFALYAEASIAVTRDYVLRVAKVLGKMFDLRPQRAAKRAKRRK